MGLERLGELRWGYSVVKREREEGMRGSVEELLDIATDSFEDGERCPNVCVEPVEKINPNEVTIQNVRMMVERSFHFVKDVEREASDSFWDIKTSEALPTKEDIRELLRRWCAQPCSVREQQRYLGIYNPRLNEVYRTRADAISDDVITEFEKTL